MINEQTEWLWETLSGLGTAVITSDVAGNVVRLNPSAEAVTGWTQAEAAGAPLTTVFEIVNDETLEPVESPWSRVLREGVGVGLANHTLLITKNGERRLIDDSAAPLRGTDGEITGVMLIFRDITLRRRSEQEVKEALAFANDIISTLRRPLLVLDAELRVKMANPSFYEAFHVSKAETEGRFIHDLGAGQWDLLPLNAALAEVLAGNGSAQEVEVQSVFPELGHRTMLLNARPVEREGSQSLEREASQRELILLVIEDVTDRREHELRVKHSELRYRRLFETAKDGILILDAGTGTIVDANPYMCGLLGYEHDEFLGKELWNIGMFGDIEASRIAYKELQDRGYVRYENLPLKTKAGRQVEVEFVSNVYSVADRQVIQCNIRDITVRIQLERKTQEQAKSLAELHRRKDEFLAMLSHELRNPLAVTSNAVHLLAQNAAENPVQQRARTMIERQVVHLTHLVDDLLEISRISTGRIRLNRTRLDLIGAVEQAVEACRPLLNRRRHELSVSLPPDPIWLDADPTRLEQVVVNLLSNAAKYTDEGGRIWLSVRPEAGAVALRVRDAGIGIAADMLPHIFDLFSQADRSLDRSEGGLGIGLCLVRRIAELHSGTVDAKSPGLGHGSEFTVRLPIHPSAAQPGVPTAPAATPAASSQRVLVVDDNVDVADSTAMVLESFGHDVRIAHNGPAALEIAGAFLPELILMDIGLPGMNGYEVAQRIRLDPRFNRVWLVAVTGYARATDVKLAEEAGFDSHLAKPLDIRRVQEILAALCR